MYCKKRKEEITEQHCMDCWKTGQRKRWYKRMVEEYGYKPSSGHRAYLLRRDCRMNYWTNKPPQTRLTVGDVTDAD